MSLHRKSVLRAMTTQHANNNRNKKRHTRTHTCPYIYGRIYLIVRVDSHEEQHTLPGYLKIAFFVLFWFYFFFYYAVRCSCLKCVLLLFSLNNNKKTHTPYERRKKNIQHAIQSGFTCEMIGQFSLNAFYCLYSPVRLINEIWLALINCCTATLPPLWREQNGRTRICVYIYSN